MRFLRPLTLQCLLLFFPQIFADSITQLRASIDQIRLEQLSTLDNLDELKPALSGKITGLEMGFAQASSHQEMAFKAELNDVCKEVQIQKASLTQELTAFRLETQEGLNTLCAQLSEIISYINRGRDD
ncbi:hypothetical protein F511_23966 [Dorcoceras hygrometricum]|uniref:Uncharacterized protein n=1 Tax=Dorcoceras hygrometricum TaxID=472368 RepID=A0A2Z7B1E3_9LAMI|nr:hypothetical protein F511_23966 [Dorcoceras hygrometricum]